MQEVLENAQKQAKEDKSKHLQKKRHNPEEIKEKTPEIVVISNCEQKTCPTEIKPQPNVSKPVEVAKEISISKLPEVDATLQTSPSSLNRQKLLTPSKFRNQTASIAIQTEMLKYKTKELIELIVFKQKQCAYDVMFVSGNQNRLEMLIKNL